MMDPVDQELPLAVVRAVAQRRDAKVIETSVSPIVTGNLGVATASVERVTGVVRSGAGEQRFSLIRKAFQPVRSGRHTESASDPRHWAYWRREPLAYASGLLINPLGAGLVAPYCYDIIDDVVYLADVGGPPEQTDVAAHRLGAWQVTAPIPKHRGWPVTSCPNASPSPIWTGPQWTHHRSSRRSGRAGTTCSRRSTPCRSRCATVTSTPAT